MTIKDLSFEKIENYDPYNSRAKRNGMVTEWVARNSWGNAVALNLSIVQEPDAQTQSR